MEEMRDKRMNNKKVLSHKLKQKREKMEDKGNPWKVDKQFSSIY